MGQTHERAVLPKALAQKQCYHKALVQLELDPQYPAAWTYLGVSGGGVVDGVLYSKDRKGKESLMIINPYKMEDSC